MENYYVILQKQLSSIEFMNEHRPEHLRYLKDVDGKG